MIPRLYFVLNIYHSAVIAVYSLLLKTFLIRVYIKSILFSLSILLDIHGEIWEFWNHL